MAKRVEVPTTNTDSTPEDVVSLPEENATAVVQPNSPSLTVIAQAEVVQDIYLFEQATPSTTWQIKHPMGREPSVEVVRSDGKHVITTIIHDSIKVVRVQFKNPTSGKAILR